MIEGWIMMIEGVKNRAFHFNFHWQREPRLKKLWTLTQAASIESVSLRRLVGWVELILFGDN